MILPHESQIVGQWITGSGSVAADDSCARIETLVASHLIEVARSSDGWTTLYQDPDDARYWEHSYPQGHLQGGGPPSLIAISKYEASAKYDLPA
jgi:hypothetical protein